MSLQRAAREVASTREGLETNQDIVAARRVLDVLEPPLRTARSLADPVARLAELQRTRLQVADVARRHPRAQQTTSTLRELDAEISALSTEIATVAAAAAAGVGRVFRDCPDCPECPEMVVVTAGATRLASGLDVTIAAPFAVGKFEVTFEEWDACVAQGGCTHRPDDRDWGRGRQPVMNVNWDDARQYVAWLSRRTGKAYRLLSEAEWEYAAQAGSGRSSAAGPGASVRGSPARRSASGTPRATASATSVSVWRGPFSPCD